jgi:hypothetical protein
MRDVAAGIKRPTAALAAAARADGLDTPADRGLFPSPAVFFPTDPLR